MANTTLYQELPPLPEYTLHPLPPLVPGVEDKYLALALPVIVYWAVSMAFHLIDVYDLFPQYRLHTPAELLMRNHVSRWDVFRDVIVQQIIQSIVGIALAFFDPEPTYGKEDYDVAVWAQRIRLAERSIPLVLGVFGLNASGLAAKLAGSYPTIAGAVAGGNYPWLTQTMTVNGEKHIVPAFASWELLFAKAIYWWIIPAFQFTVGVLIVDTWQYFLHRAMHVNKWLYAKFHSRHHRLYVPYAYGALYNHPFEGFLLDTLGTGIAYLISGMSVRQSMWFFSCSTIKTVDDHCGYALPWDPLQFITSNNASYHDIHHQSWGIKTNFSQPFFTFWDRLLDTMWKGGDVAARYEKSRLAAQRRADDAAATGAAPGATTPSPSENVTSPEASEPEASAKATPVALRRSTRRKTLSEHQGNLKGLRDRVNESLQGKASNIRVESSH